MSAIRLLEYDGSEMRSDAPLAVYCRSHRIWAECLASSRGDRRDGCQVFLRLGRGWILFCKIGGASVVRLISPSPSCCLVSSATYETQAIV